jgi:hypothetical protein
MPGLDNRDYIFRNWDGISALPSLEPAFVKRSFKGGVQWNQLVASVGPPGQPEGLAATGGAEKSDTHQTQIVYVFDCVDELHDLFTNPRIVLDFEMQAQVHSAIYHERKADPDRDLEEIRRQVAEQLQVPMVDGQIQIPDARIEYELDQGSRATFSDIEVATAAYRPGHLRAKAQAGFRIYASPRDRSRLSAQIEGEHHTLDYILDL